ncbi:hypothetical protein ACK2SD_12485 [Pseudomonas sp. SC11]
MSKTKGARTPIEAMAFFYQDFVTLNVQKILATEDCSRLDNALPAASF